MKETTEEVKMYRVEGRVTYHVERWVPSTRASSPEEAMELAEHESSTENVIYQDDWKPTDVVVEDGGAGG